MNLSRLRLLFSVALLSAAAAPLSMHGQTMPSGSNAPTAPDTPQTAASAPAPDAPQTADPAPATTGAKDKNAKGEPNLNDSDVLGPVPTLANVKAGSLDDVNSIGTRSMPGQKGMGNWYSNETEMKMGKGYSMEIEHTIKLINDPVVNEYVNRITQNIVKNSDAKVPFTVRVIDSDEINAMALPGGFMYVNSGLILAADEEAEVAGVLAHEIGHVCAHHVAREITRSNYAQIAMIPLLFIGGWTGYGIYEGASIGIPLTFLQFQRGFEAQADYLGLQYMYKAGYDPEAFVAFFEKYNALIKQKPNLVSKAFSTHPPTPERIKHSQEEMQRILPAKMEYVVSTSEFQDVKARLARIENRRKLDDGDGKGNKPTLRRTASTTGTGDTTGQPASTDGDDRPTLHRRDD
jgi:predicted Zn-dependent protease